MDRGNDGAYALKDAVGGGGFTCPAVVDADQEDHKIRVKVGRIEFPEAALPFWKEPKQHVLRAVPGDAQVETPVLRDRPGEGLVPDGKPAALARKPEIVSHRPEIGDRVAEEHEADRSQARGIPQRGLDRRQAILPVLDTRSGLHRGERGFARTHDRGEHKQGQQPNQDPNHVAHHAIRCASPKLCNGHKTPKGLK